MKFSALINPVLQLSCIRDWPRSRSWNLKRRWCKGWNGLDTFLGFSNRVDSDRLQINYILTFQHVCFFLKLSFLGTTEYLKVGASRQRWWHLILLEPPKWTTLQSLRIPAPTVDSIAETLNFAKNLFVQLGQPQKERRAPHTQHNLVPSATSTVWWSSACAIRHSSLPLLVWVSLWFFVFCSPLSLSLSSFRFVCTTHPPSNLTISSDPDACASDSWQRTFGFNWTVKEMVLWLSFCEIILRRPLSWYFPGISWQRRNASIHLVRLRNAYMACWYLKCWLLIGLRKIEDTWINSDWLRPEAHWPWRQLWSSFWRKEFSHEKCNQISWNLQNARIRCCQWHRRHQQVGKIQSYWHAPSGWNTWTLGVFDVTHMTRCTSTLHHCVLQFSAQEHSQAYYVQDSASSFRCKDFLLELQQSLLLQPFMNGAGMCCLLKGGPCRHGCSVGLLALPLNHPVNTFVFRIRLLLLSLTASSRTNQTTRSWLMLSLSKMLGLGMLVLHRLTAHQLQHHINDPLNLFR